MLPRSLSTITLAVVHCSATPNGRYHDIADIDYWHGPDRFKRGLTPFQRPDFGLKAHQPNLQHVGYHYVVRTDGVLECGRSLRETGAHARGYNHSSVGICLIGYDQFTDRQWATLKSLALTLHQLLPNLREFKGHNQLTDLKTCPGFDVAEWVDDGLNPLSEHTLKQEDN